MSIIVEKGQLLRANIIKQLYYKKVLSLNQLSKFTQKSLPLVTSIVNNLIADGIVIEQGLAPSTGGRRPLMFLLNSNQQKFIVAVAMDQLITRLVIFDLVNNIILPLQLLELDISNDENGTDKLIAFIEGCVRKSNIDPNRILGVGIGMPGFVNSERGINYSNLNVADGFNLRDYLSERLKIPVFIDNDSSLIALAELHFGEAKNFRDVMVVNIGWGTGLGMIVNGKLYRGSSGYAGEFSHIPLSDSNNLCSCGKRGCLEVDTSLLVMTENAEKAIKAGAESSMRELFKDKNKHNGDHFLDAVVHGDPLAISILSASAFQLGKGLATLIHIMNPERIVLSGRGARAGKMLLPAIQQAINEFCIPRIAEQTSIVLSKLADRAELLAAASLVIEHTEIE